MGRPCPLYTVRRELNVGMGGVEGEANNSKLIKVVVERTILFMIMRIVF